MTWFNLLLAVVKVASIIAGYLDTKAKTDAIKKQLLADELATLITRLEIKKNVETAVAAMSDSDIDRGLHDAGDYRD